MTLTDDDSNTETLEVETVLVPSNAAPTSADRTVTTAEDTSYTFGSVDFAFADTTVGDALMSVKVVTLPGAGRLALGGVAVTANQAIGTSDLVGLVFTPAANAHGAGYASFTFKVSDGESDSAVANTLTVDVTAVNDPASGLAITGTAREGQTLTADTTNIVDADGLTSPNYRYQWVRVDGGDRDGSRHGIDACGDIGGPGQEAEGEGDADGRRQQHGDPGGRDGVGAVQRGADVGGPDGDDGRGHVLHVRVGGLCFADMDGGD